MTILFGLLAVAMVGLALAMLVPTLFRTKPPATALGAQADAHLSVLREQLAQADADHAAGALDARQHAAARAEIERRALEEDRGRDVDAPVAAARHPRSAWAVAIAIPLLAVGLYAQLGRPGATSGDVAAAAPPQQGFTPEQVEAMVQAIEKKLNTDPPPADAAQGWQLLARAYGSMQRFAEADRAFANARKLVPDDPQLMADHADVLAMVRGQKVSGEPERLALRALAIDPKHPKALALAGTAAFERQDFRGAMAYWQRARAGVPDGTELAAGLDSSIAEAKAASGGTVASAGSPRGAASPASAAPAAAARITGTVRLAPALASRVAPDDTVFIYARAAEGPRMPLAIVKRKASELPIAFTLDDSMAMAPQMKLSLFPSVIVSARVSRSGNAAPQSGDLVGESGAVKSAGSGALSLAIDRVQP